MKHSLLLLAIVTFVSLCTITSGNEINEKVAEKFGTKFDFSTVKFLCKICLPGRGQRTRRLIRRKGCPRNHDILKCKFGFKRHLSVKGLRCDCRPRPSPSPTPSPTPSPSPSPSPSPAMTIECDEVARSGGQGTTTVSVELAQTSGTFQLMYQMFTIPDQLEVFYEGNIIFTTGGLVSGSQTVSVPYSGASTQVTVVVSAPQSGTAWTFTVFCPTRR